MNGVLLPRLSRNFTEMTKNDNTLKQSHNTIVLCFYGMIPYFFIFYDTMFFLYEDSHKMRLIH